MEIKRRPEFEQQYNTYETTKGYYDYYYSQRPIDPRLKKPTWNPLEKITKKFAGLKLKNKQNILDIFE